MGAASSVKLIYQDANTWFRHYFDDESFVSDFYLIDKDRDGAIRYQDFISWLQAKSVQDPSGPWKFFVSHPEIVAIAHCQSCGENKDNKNDVFPKPEKIVNIHFFRILLIHLFVVSIFWVHFKKADEWNNVDPADSCQTKLTFEEFTFAVRSFCSAYGQEQITDEQLRQDFDSLGVDANGCVSLVNVCTVCGRFILPGLLSRGISSVLRVDTSDVHRLRSNSSEDEVEVSSNVTSPVSRPGRKGGSFLSLRMSTDVTRHRDTFQAIVNEIEKNERICDFMQMKLHTEQLISAQHGSVF